MVTKSKITTTKEVIRSLSEGLRHAAISPNINGYTPHERQADFHSSDAKKRLFLGGNRSGKTVGGATESIWWLTGSHPYIQTPDPPVRGRCVSVDFINGVEKIVKPEVARWLPPSALRGGTWEHAYDKELRTLHLTNGSFLEFMCVDEQTEILCRDKGWVKRDKLEIGDVVLTYSSVKKSYEWQTVTAIPTYDVDTVMTRITNKSNTFDALVTPDHRWVTERKGDGLIEFRHTKDLTKNLNLVVAAKQYLEGTSDEYSSEYCELWGYWLGDGAKHTKRQKIYQSHINIADQIRIEELLDILKVEYDKYSNAVYTVWTFDVMFFYPTTSLLAELTSEGRSALLDGLIKSDGYVNKYGQWSFTNTDFELIDLVSTLGILCGYNTKFRDRPCSEWGVKPVRVVYGDNPQAKRSPYRVSVDNLQFSYEEYKGIVWCVMVPNHTFVMRRNGIICITGNSMDQDVDKFAGTSRHFIWFDEEPPRDIYIECLQRLIDTEGRFWITMTPVDGMSSWVYDDLYEGAKVDESVHVTEVEMDQNPHINVGEMLLLMSGLTDEERKARQQGKFVQIGGLIYSKYFSEKNVINQLEKVPDNWLHIAAMDHGFSNPTAWLWAVVGPDGQIIIYDEYYQSGEIVEYHVSQVHSINKIHGRVPDYYVGDPSIRNTDPITGTSVLLEYMDFGIPIVLGNNDVRAGINRVARYFQGIEAHPRLYITKNCHNLLREIPRYRWGHWANRKMRSDRNKKEEPHKKDDHAVDALRYLIASRPELDDGTYRPSPKGPMGQSEAITSWEVRDNDLERDLKPTVYESMGGLEYD